MLSSIVYTLAQTVTSKEASRQYNEGRQKGESSGLVKKLQRWQRKHKVRGEELHMSGTN